MPISFSISEQNYDNIKTAQAALDMIVNYEGLKGSEYESVKQIAFVALIGLCDTINEMKKSIEKDG